MSHLAVKILKIKVSGHVDVLVLNIHVTRYLPSNRSIISFDHSGQAHMGYFGHCSDCIRQETIDTRETRHYQVISRKMADL